MATSPEFLTKRSGESILYALDFANQLASGETISTVSSITGAPSGLTIGAGAISGTEVRFRVSAGTSGTRYCITVTITTSASNTRIECVELLVQDCCE